MSFRSRARASRPHSFVLSWRKGPIAVAVGLALGDRFMPTSLLTHVLLAGLCLLFGVLPARRAAALDPVLALEKR